MSRVEDFLKLTGQTNQSPYLIDVDRAEGIYIIDKNGKRYIDMISGVGDHKTGPRHPRVISAVEAQVEQPMHVMLYGEYIQDAPLDFCKVLVSLLTSSLDCGYAVNSGTGANEAALKLA